MTWQPAQFSVRGERQSWNASDRVTAGRFKQTYWEKLHAAVSLFFLSFVPLTTSEKLSQVTVLSQQFLIRSFLPEVPESNIHPPPLPHQRYQWRPVDGDSMKSFRANHVNQHALFRRIAVLEQLCQSSWQPRQALPLKGEMLRWWACRDWEQSFCRRSDRKSLREVVFSDTSTNPSDHFLKWELDSDAPSLIARHFQYLLKPPSSVCQTFHLHFS